MPVSDLPSDTGVQILTYDRGNGLAAPFDTAEILPTIPTNDNAPRSHRLRLHLCMLYDRAMRVVMS